MTESRTDALLWWADLYECTKEYLFEEYRGFNFTPAQKHSELTGREIENIYKCFTWNNSAN